MAEVLSRYNFRRGARPSGSKYDQFFDGKIYRLFVGEDIPNNGDHMDGYLRMRARKAGKKLSISRESNALVIKARRR